jgi:hypothetical protein
MAFVDDIGSNGGRLRCRNSPRARDRAGASAPCALCACYENEIVLFSYSSESEDALYYCTLGSVTTLYTWTSVVLKYFVDEWYLCLGHALNIVVQGFPDRMQSLLRPSLVYLCYPTVVVGDIPGACYQLPGQYHQLRL